jgi:hypothetical protein
MPLQRFVDALKPFGRQADVFRPGDWVGGDQRPAGRQRDENGEDQQTPGMTYARDQQTLL